MNISIVPRKQRGYILKKVQVFNNSVVYASQEKGGNLIVKEQWLEKPIWDIYILIDDNKNIDKITHSFLNNSFVYMPYLGKNDHCANITDVALVDIKETTNYKNVNSLFIRDSFEFKKDKKNIFDSSFQNEDMWKCEERLPIALKSKQNQYITVPFVFINMKVQPKESCKVFSDSGKIIFFF